MTDLSKLALVWGEAHTDGGPATGPGVSVTLWANVLDKPWLRWNPLSDRGPDLSEYNTVIVNMFHSGDSVHIEAIRQNYPDMFIIAAPDAPIDFIASNPDWMRVLRQMSFANAIGGRTHADCAVLGRLFDKPAFYLPSPIGPESWLDELRALPKEDYILTLDHSFLNMNTLLNVTALALIQRETGLRVVYAAARDWTPEYAKLAGLKAEFVGYVGSSRFAEMTAQAKLVVDMYAAHSYGRQQVLAASVGTPVVGSDWCVDAPGLKCDPYDPMKARMLALKALARPHDYTFSAMADARGFNFENSRKRMEGILYDITKLKGRTSG